MTTYTAGSITVAKNSLKVYGQNTNWLAAEIKATDLFIIGGSVYEIAEVNSSNEITLFTKYTGDNIAGVGYTIIKVAEQVIAADLASMLYACVTEHNTLIRKYGEIIKDFRGVAEIIKKARLYIDDDGDLAQDDTEDQRHTGKDESVTDPEVATDSELDEMMNEILG